jgi:hypothetical protein
MGMLTSRAGGLAAGGLAGAGMQAIRPLLTFIITYRVPSYHPVCTTSYGERGSGNCPLRNFDASIRDCITGAAGMWLAVPTSCSSYTQQ